jgi:hypothetical protein
MTRDAMTTETPEQHEARLRFAVRYVLDDALGRFFVYWVVSQLCRARADASSWGDATPLILGRQQVGRELVDALNAMYPSQTAAMYLEAMDRKEFP